MVRGKRKRHRKISAVDSRLRKNASSALPCGYDKSPLPVPLYPPCILRQLHRRQALPSMPRDARSSRMPDSGTIETGKQIRKTKKCHKCQSIQKRIFRRYNYSGMDAIFVAIMQHIYAREIGINGQFMRLYGISLSKRPDGWVTDGQADDFGDVLRKPSCRRNGPCARMKRSPSCGID